MFTIKGEFMGNYIISSDGVRYNLFGNLKLYGNFYVLMKEYPDGTYFPLRRVRVK